MQKDAIKSLRNMETRYGLDASTLNQPFVTGKAFSPSKPGAHDIPVVDTHGKTVGSVAKQEMRVSSDSEEIDLDELDPDPQQVAS